MSAADNAACAHVRQETERLSVLAEGRTQALRASIKQMSAATAATEAVEILAAVAAATNESGKVADV